MPDPSFIRSSAAAKDLFDYAREMQAIVDCRAAASEQPLTVAGADLGIEVSVAPPGHRAGVGSASILPFLNQSLRSRPTEGRNEVSDAPSVAGGTKIDALGL